MFEAEVLPLFLGGMVLVFVFEVIFSVLVLRKAPAVKRAMFGHVVCLLIAFFCLGYMLFWPQILPDGGQANRSGAAPHLQARDEKIPEPLEKFLQGSSEV